MISASRLTLAAALVAVGTSAQAALFDRGGGMIYDDVLDITWLADWNHAKTSGYDADGRMSWLDANGWATGLSYGGFDDWRLPVIAQPDAGCSEFSAGPPPIDFGYGCTASEMGRMFYVNWGAISGVPFDFGTETANLALFQNVERGTYWTRDESLGVNAWYLQTVDGGQFTADKDDLAFAVAVRNGDVGTVAVAVPAPASATLMLAGIAGLALRSTRGKGDDR
jgi:hypothetical protein